MEMFFNTDYTDFRRWKKIKLLLRVNPRFKYTPPITQIFVDGKK